MGGERHWICVTKQRRKLIRSIRLCSPNHAKNYKQLRTSRCGLKTHHSKNDSRTTTQIHLMKIKIVAKQKSGKNSPNIIEPSKIDWIQVWQTFMTMFTTNTRERPEKRVG